MRRWNASSPALASLVAVMCAFRDDAHYGSPGNRRMETSRVPVLASPLASPTQFSPHGDDSPLLRRGGRHTSSLRGLPPALVEPVHSASNTARERPRFTSNQWDSSVGSPATTRNIILNDGTDDYGLSRIISPSQSVLSSPRRCRGEYSSAVGSPAWDTSSPVAARLHPQHQGQFSTRSSHGVSRDASQAERRRGVSDVPLLPRGVSQHHLLPESVKPVVLEENLDDDAHWQDTPYLPPNQAKVC